MNHSLIQNVHLVFVGISLVVVFLSLVFSILYLLQQRQLKHKKNLLLFAQIPSLESLDRYVIRCLVLASISLSVLLITGVFLAHSEWHGDWLQNRKFLAAIFTWVWVFITLFFRFRMGVRGERFFYLIMIGMACLVASCLLAWMV